VKAAAVIGSLFSIQPEARTHWRRETWGSGQNELRHMVFNSIILSVCHSVIDIRIGLL